MEHYKVGQMTPVELLDLLKSAQSVPTRMVLDRTVKNLLNTAGGRLADMRSSSLILRG